MSLKHKLLEFPALYYYILWARDIILRVFNKKKDDSSYESRVFTAVGRRLGVNTFFGYYDKSPILSGKVIYHESNNTILKPNRRNRVFVVVYDVSRSIEVYRQQIYAFNWQQGARAHWISENKFIYNNFIDSVFSSVIVDLDTGEELIYEYSLADSCDKYLLTLDYKNLSITDPSYGYFNLEGTGTDVEPIRKVDLNTLNVIELVTINDVRAKSKHRDKNKTKETFNHVMISPCNHMFVFIYRYKINNIRYDELYLFNVRTNELKRLNLGDYISHYCWLDSCHLFGHVSCNDNKKGFYTYNIKTDQAFCESRLSSFTDGHPTKVTDSKVIFDSYPDKYGMQMLYTYDLYLKEVEQIGAFYHPVLYRGVSRCDLHPRYDSDTNSLFIDTVHSNKRQLIQINLYKKL